MSTTGGHTSRRQLLLNAGGGVGAMAVAHLFARQGLCAGNDLATDAGAVLKKLHTQPRAKRIIYLFQSGGPSQLDLFDYKPLLNQRNGEPLPDSVRRGQRLTTMSGNQAILPLAGSIFKFAQHGPSGAWLSELLPHTAQVADKLCFVRSMFTEAINHDPAITFFQTGSQVAGRPSIGSWLHYGLGSENENLPAFVVLVTQGQSGQPLYARLWGSGFLESKYQGVQLRAGADPVLYLSNPAGVDSNARKQTLNAAKLDGLQKIATLDPEIDSRIAQLEMAFRLQSSIPEVTNVVDEPQSVLDLYGPDVGQPGTFAANCLLARRLVERGVRFVQLFHQDWDHHGGLPSGIKKKCAQTDQPSAALVRDLAQRGLLDDTLVVWGGEFGRTNYSQGKLTANNYGRDHHPRCFTMWLAGGGIKPGTVWGETDEFGYNVASAGVHVHDLHATILHLLGVDHEQLTFKYQGRRFRLTDVHGKIVKGLIQA